ncbi:MAG: SDR family oxidoreductase [Ignavibacteriaceae bacterium]|nr:SDR family oxidoreductase [Ignavibacteriaceae bacterium]
MQKKIILVTGANRGIGKEICRQLAESDASVLLSARDFIKAKGAASEMKGRVTPVQLDVTSPESAENVVNTIKNEFGRLDVLINNAGIIGKKPLAECAVDDLKEVFEVNYFGAVRLTKACLPLLKQSQGSIINISSGMGALGDLTGGYGPYRLSKAHLNAYTILLANELRGSGVRANAVCPGWVKTEMGGAGATRTVEKGAETPVWLALEDKEITGKFIRDKKIISW